MWHQYITPWPEEISYLMEGEKKKKTTPKLKSFFIAKIDITNIDRSVKSPSHFFISSAKTEIKNRRGNSCNLCNLDYNIIGHS